MNIDAGSAQGSGSVVNPWTGPCPWVVAIPRVLSGLLARTTTQIYSKVWIGPLSA